MDAKRIWMWVGIAAAVIVIGLGAWYLLGAGQQATVPDVVGQNGADAVRALQAARFTLGTTTETTNTAQAAGTVVSQDPPAGTSAKKGSAVNLTVAKANPYVTVPDVKGKEASAAAEALVAVGLVPVTYSDFNQAPADTVFGQAPAAGSRVATGTTVAIGISRGPAPSNPKVPNVLGKKQADATEAIKKAGFVAKVYEGYSSSVAAGLVITQFPAGGTVALAGSEVAIEVSKGKAPSTPSNVTVPNVVGRTQADATSALEKVGLGVEAYTTYSDTVAKGSVIMQLPKAGEVVAPGTVIGIAVSLGKKPTGTTNVTVPDVVGDKVEQAQKTLTDLGLKPVVVPDAASTATPNTVTAQLPAAGSSVAPGTEIAIVVATKAVPTPY